MSIQSHTLTPRVWWRTQQSSDPPRWGSSNNLQRNCLVVVVVFVVLSCYSKTTIEIVWEWVSDFLLVALLADEINEAIAEDGGLKT